MDHGRINSRGGDPKGITTRLMPCHDRSDSAVVGFLESKGVGKELITLSCGDYSILCYALH
jgi:hypothetical protein